jgi:hypothetical protein
MAERIPFVKRWEFMPADQRAIVGPCDKCVFGAGGLVALCETHEVDEIFRRVQ